MKISGKIEIYKDFVVGRYYSADIVNGKIIDTVNIEYLGIKEEFGTTYHKFLDKKNMEIVTFGNNSLESDSVDLYIKDYDDESIRYIIKDQSTYKHWELIQEGENSTSFKIIVKTPWIERSTTFSLDDAIEKLSKR